ncbi:MAG: uracil-DNA glycosylase [Verrucomicrobiota bacterium]
MPFSSAQILLRYLQEQKDRGRERLWLTQDAVNALHSLHSRPTAHAAPMRNQSTPSPAEPPTAAATPAPSDPTTPARIPGNNKQSELDALRARAESAEAPRALGTLRDTMVFAVGSPDADLVFVGEAPGFEEEKQREPFVGPAGQLLDKIIFAMGLQRSDIYISNICKFRPKIGDGQHQGMKNRKPEPQEMDACVEFVREEIKVIQPKAIIALGGTAMEGLLGISGSVSSQRGFWHDLGGTPVAVTYHPSYLLRNAAISEKRKVWEDMLMVMEKTGMPISEKQRRFFSK